jgi:predicted house-cleaning noncanonical NTP pyrophosphatase (MazG superfamily)
MKIAVFFSFLLVVGTQAFQVMGPRSQRPCLLSPTGLRAEESDADVGKKETVGNLVADDEWEGLGIELSELVRIAVLEDLKKKGRDFLQKDDYKVGDFTKELDNKVKAEVANFRGKEEYELGDFVLAMDEASKKMTEELTGKPYEAGDLSKELDSRIKSAVAEYCGKEEYTPGDLTQEVSTRVMSRVEDFVGKDYEIGDVSREIENRRRAWVKDFLGEEAAANYQFGDITKKAVSKFTGKDTYEFGGKNAIQYWGLGL